MKKLYSKILMQLVLALYTFNFTACQQFDIDSQPEAPLNIQIDALDAYDVLATSPSNVVFNISSNTPWSITSDQQWCKPSPAMSAASSLVSEIVVTIENNLDKKSRTATLTIKAENIEKEKVITITQASKEELQIIPYGDIIRTEGETITFDIISNKPWRIIPSAQFISNIDKISGEGNNNGDKETVSIIIPENPGAKRYADVIIRTDYEEKSFTITQDGLSIEPVNPEEKTNEMDGICEKTIEISSNIEWKVNVPDEFKEWLSAEADGNNLKLKTTAINNLFIPRTGHVLLYPKQNISGFEGVPIEISQQSQFTFTTGGTYSIDETTGYAKVMKCNIASKYLVSKGHLTFEFDEINLSAASKLSFYMRPLPDKANTNFYFQLQSSAECIFQSGGTGLAWAQKKFALTTEEINAIRKIEFYIEDDPNNIGKLRLRLLIDSVEKAIIENRNNGFQTDPEDNPGLTINIEVAPEANDYYVIKSVTHEPEV